MVSLLKLSKFLSDTGDPKLRSKMNSARQVVCHWSGCVASAVAALLLKRKGKHAAAAETCYSL